MGSAALLARLAATHGSPARRDPCSCCRTNVSEQVSLQPATDSQNQDVPAVCRHSPLHDLVCPFLASQATPAHVHSRSTAGLTAAQARAFNQCGLGVAVNGGAVQRRAVCRVLIRACASMRLLTDR